MSFQFRLSSVQKIRENTRDRRRLTLTEAEHTADEIAFQCDTLKTQAEEIRQEKERLLRAGGSLAFAMFLAYERREAWLHEEQKRLANLLRDAKHHAEKCRADLLEADKEVKTLEKLEEKQRERHHAECEMRNAELFS